jgi:hypothetical protein
MLIKKNVKKSNYLTVNTKNIVFYYIIIWYYFETFYLINVTLLHVKNKFILNN